MRIVASTYFVDGDGGTIGVDGARLTGPYTLLVIGEPQTMQTALHIPGGVVASVETAGGSVTMQAAQHGRGDRAAPAGQSAGTRVRSPDRRCHYGGIA